MTKQKFDKPRRLIKPEDGTIAYTWEGKLHNWDGPALIPKGDKRKREYYIYGIKYTEDEWKEIKRNRTGLPWYKNPSMRDSARDAG
jgi:hypothetical protein